MEKNFNLKKYYTKTAFYEGSRGYWNALTRGFSNCYKRKSDEKLGPQDAWNSCLEEFQTSEAQAKWKESYSSDNDDAPVAYHDAKTPAVTKNKIKKGKN